MTAAPALADHQTGRHYIAIVHAFYNTMAALPIVLPRPIVLLLGEVVIANAEWESLAAIAELRVSICSKQKASIPHSDFLACSNLNVRTDRNWTKRLI